ncbi:beta-glucosidase [Friedmanniella endophytica]|uniref:Beta-glucosidase n=1 Tax=Microlunatus kandeliicorticis TaxID=1759536 RepID=A0A7W3ITJ4_9ACTN|nr:GH1 family beta-glucosidase [Microlunatus kandeliicorticis]MBA8794987.1 beta-glucosidase [Microlunatus kandeliicorticis]
MSTPARTSTARAFPADLTFGVATAAFQIEGASHTDGRTDSIWDAFCRVPGAVINGDDGSVACDHYHRYAEDVALMAELGVQSYRFSTSWARIRPDGGPVNQRGLDFYRRLVDELLAHGIRPWLTLYHWDLPQAIEEQGGWAARDTAERFRDYALDVNAALGDRVDVWTTLNEPWCAAFLGYLAGAHAPGRQETDAALAAGHHLMLGHGLAVQALREQRADLTLGCTLNFTVAEPLDPGSEDDRDAARRIDGQMNRFFLDPIVRGAYPEDVLADLDGLGLERVVRDGDLAVISTPIDALGVNYYHGESVSTRPPAEPFGGEAPTDRQTRSPFPAAEVFSHSQGLPTTAMGWEIQPDGLAALLTRLHTDYTGPAGIALWVTENGAAMDDRVGPDGQVEDGDREAFLLAHLDAVAGVIEAGVPVHGYFYWSLLDNFEWAWGYAKRFGLVRVDYDTQRRTPKRSARRYAEVIATRRLPDGR